MVALVDALQENSAIGRRHVENLLVQVELIREAYKITRVSGWTDERQEALETWREIDGLAIASYFAGTGWGLAWRH